LQNRQEIWQMQYFAIFLHCWLLRVKSGRENYMVLFPPRRDQQSDSEDNDV